MNRVRLVMLFAVLALIVALVPAASAQDQTFGLTQEEFDALTAANANSAMASSYEYAFTFTVDVAQGGTTSTEMALDGSGAVSDGFSMAVTGTLGSGANALPADLGLIVAGDSLYVQLQNQWYGATGDELAQQFGAMLPVDPQALASGDLSALEGQMGDMSGMMSGLENLDPTAFISMTAAPDGDTTVYTITVDLAAVLSDPNFQQILMMAAASSGGTADLPSAADLKGATLTITQTVNTAASQVEQTVLNAVLPAEGATSTLNFDISLSNYGAAPAVTAPADAQPLAQLMQMFMGGMGGM